MKGHQAVISVAKLCPGIKFIFAGKGTQCLDVPENVLLLASATIWKKYTMHGFGHGF